MSDKLFLTNSLYVLLIIALLALPGCKRGESNGRGDITSKDSVMIDKQETVLTNINNDSGNPPALIEWNHPRSGERLEERTRMVDTISRYYRFNDEQVLDAIMNVPRHWFVPASQQGAAYRDSPLSIGFDQTISQPYIVAFMTGQLGLDPEKKVLEIGTGSGYQAAVLSELTPQVFTIEIVEPLAHAASERLKKLGYDSIQLRCGDGYLGWPEEQPFDAIIATCAPEHIPPALIEQLKPDGRLVIPVGSVHGIQSLILVTKDDQGRIRKKELMMVRFVPLVRE